jgi:hypothetical protein
MSRLMHHFVRFLPALAATLIAASTAHAVSNGQMTPLLDLRQLHAKAILEGVPDEHYLYPPSPFAAFDDIASAQVEGVEAGSADASAYQNSAFFSNGINAFGATSGQFQVRPGGYEALSLSTMTFSVDTCMTYFLDATVEPGDAGSSGDIVFGVPIGPHMITVASGHQTLQGRLAPGEYFIEGRSQISTLGENMGGPAYAIIWTCQPCASPFIHLQPQDVWKSPGSNAQFSITPNPGPAQEGTAAFTYQWRKNLTPLANNAHIGGVTTTTLSITNVAAADSGWYDVVVTSGPVTEPSRLARLTVTSSTGVGDPTPQSSSLRFTLDGAAPNPSAGSASFRFSTSRPVDVDAAVYDASGRMVRRIAAGLISGTGTFRWDGRSTANEVSPAGVYFLRVRVDGETHMRRFVRMK